MSITRKYSLDEIKALAEAFGQLPIAQKHTPADLTLGGHQLHGFLHSGGGYGILSEPAVRPQMHSAWVRPKSLGRLLRPEPSIYINEIYDIWTGVTDATGRDPETWCGNPPEPGYGKTCTQRAIFGAFFAKTHLNAIPEIGQLANRADVPREWLASPPQDNPLLPDLFYRLVDSQSQLQYELFTFGARAERALEKVLIEGSTAVSGVNAEWGWELGEFNGIEQLITTGYADWRTEVLCPALDSVVVDFGGHDIGATVGGGDPRDISQVLVDTVFSLRNRGDSMGYSGFTLVAVMRPELFRMLTYALACDFTSFRCRTTAGSEGFNAETERRLQQEMFQGQYLWVDGVIVPVIFSHGIDLNGFGNNTYQSDLFLVPVEWNGKRLTRLEYFPMNNPYAMEYANAFGSGHYDVINNGLYAVSDRDNGFCKEYIFGAKMRLILETPMLAGRIDNIRFAYRAETRAPFPGESFYYDGGETYINWNEWLENYGNQR